MILRSDSMCGLFWKRNELCGLDVPGRLEYCLVPRYVDFYYRQLSGINQASVEAQNWFFTLSLWESGSQYFRNLPAEAVLYFWEGPYMIAAFLGFGPGMSCKTGPVGAAFPKSAVKWRDKVYNRSSGGIAIFLSVS